MSAQTLVDKYIIPDGMNMAISTDNNTWSDVGLLAGGTTLTHNFTKETINGGNKTKIIERVKDQTLAVAPSALWSQDLDVFEKFGGGLYTTTTTAGSLVSSASQAVASGSWSFNQFIKIENQNYDGGAITVNSVTGGTDGLLTVVDDYFVGQDSNGNYGIFIIDSVDVTTESQLMTINYDYTPAASKMIEAGSSLATLTNFVIRLRHYTDVALTTYDMEVFVHSASMDAGLQLNFKGQNEDGLFETTVAFTGGLDETLTDGKQLFSWLVATSALN